MNEKLWEVSTGPAHNASLWPHSHSLNHQFPAQLDVQDIDMLHEPIDVGNSRPPELQNNEPSSFVQCHESQLADHFQEWRLLPQAGELAIESSKSSYLWDSARGISPTGLNQDDLADSDFVLANDLLIGLEEDNDSGNCHEVCFGMVRSHQYIFGKMKSYSVLLRLLAHTAGRSKPF